MRASLLLILLTAACGEPSPSPVDNAVNGVPAPPPAEEANQTKAEPALRTAEAGPLSFRYDPSLLAKTDVDVQIPPDWSRQVRGTKLVPRDRIDLIGKAECMYGLSGQAQRCTAEKEAGLAFALLDTPFEEMRGRIEEPAPSEVTMAGRDGIRWEIGAEGEGADYILLPADGGTMLIVHQYRTSGNPDEQAVQAVLDSLAFED